jgi:uncharacterized glyoxalase superfamily protein PhnB
MLNLFFMYPIRRKAGIFTAKFWIKMPVKGIMKILGETFPSTEAIKGVHKCELYLSVANIEECYSRALEAGAVELSPVALRNWGDRVGYLSDPDGHIIAFAS